MGFRAVLNRPAVYELLQFLFGYRRRLVREFIRPTTGMKILDIGCGPASILKYLPKDVEYVGYDLDARYIAYAQRRFGDRGRFYCASVAQALQQAQDATGFDLVMAIGVLHHLDDEDAKQVQAQAWSCLKPGGTLLTHDPIFDPAQSRAAHFFAAHDRGTHVRTRAQHDALVQNCFTDVETHILTDMYSVPYTILINRAKKTPGVEHPAPNRER